MVPAQSRHGRPRRLGLVAVVDDRRGHVALGGLAQEGRQATLQQLSLTREAEDLGHRRLLDSLLVQAQARRRGVEVGRRSQSLDAVARAGRLMRDLGLTSEKQLLLRNEAIACIALVDLLPIRTLPELPGADRGPGGELSDIYLPFDADFSRCARMIEDRCLAILDTTQGTVLRRLATPPGIFAGGFRAIREPNQ